MELAAILAALGLTAFLSYCFGYAAGYKADQEKISKQQVREEGQRDDPADWWKK